jgi:ribosomal protein S18 acetylase RimI-like enzyme
MTRRLRTEFARVSLGVSVDNPRAIALNERLGFTDSLERAGYLL